MIPEELPGQFLIMAMPVAWKGVVEQYAGRLNREYEGKEEKYIAFLEADLGKKGKTYAALVDCYQRQGNIDAQGKTARVEEQPPMDMEWRR